MTSQTWIDLHEFQRRQHAEARIPTNVEQAMAAPAPSADSEPIPLFAPTQAPRPYPLDALPPTLRHAVIAYQRYGQQPLALTACSALAAASLAAQGLANVARDRNLVGPISLNVLMIAESGERKTSADRRFAKAARQWVDDRREALKPDLAAKQAAVLAHKAECDGVEAKIKSAAGKRGVEAERDLAELKRRLAELKQSPPPNPITPALFHEDVTPEGLAQEIAGGWPSSSLWSDEGGLVVGSHGMSEESALRFLGLLNRLWDGNSFDRKRIAAKSCTISGRRFTCSLMLQELVFARLLGVAGGSARGTGFLARYLVCWPPSTMGTRLYVDGDMDGPELRAFDRRIRELLDMPLPVVGSEMVLEPPVLHLSPEARQIWIEFHNSIEVEIGASGEHGQVADFASKAAEQAARIAAVLHVFEHGPYGEIVAETMAAGAKLAAWHLYEARRIITAADRPQEISDAALIEDWLASRGEDRIELRELLRVGPAPVRNRVRRDRAVAKLIDYGRATEVKIGQRSFLQVNPRARVTG